MLELLNNNSHKDLRIVTRRGARWGDDHMSCPVTPDEFRQLQAHYPIVFQPDGKGSLMPVVLFGLEQGENLFLDGEEWNAEYIPLAMQRMPFSIGVDGDELRVMVDMASPRISQGAEGEAVFLQHGGTTEYIEHVNAILRTLHEGLQSVPEFVGVLVEHGLLESFVLDVERPDGSHGQLVGYSMINEERLASLDASVVALLHAADYLQPIYMAVASLSNITPLIRKHLARETAAA